MTDQFVNVNKMAPITPPPKLVEQWLTEFYGPQSMPRMAPGEMVLHVAAVAARWGADQQLRLDAEQINQAWQKGADQELEACCKWLPKLPPWSADDLRKHRRPKPTSLKEQALGALYAIATGVDGTREFRQDLETIKQALESLPDV